MTQMGYDLCAKILVIICVAIIINGCEQKEKDSRTDIVAYIESRQLILTKKVQSLKNEFPVIIDKELLATIAVTDFEKSRWANLLIYKSGSGRLAVPVVDPTWSF